MTLVTVRREGNIHAADWGAGPRRCAIGWGGIAAKQREGDGITPIGTWPVRRVLYRADRLSVLVPGYSLRAIEPDDGWCDAPNDGNYNLPVKLPYPASAEKLWREDSLYDIIVVLGFNDAPVIAGAGSAVFVHVAAPDFDTTAGCVALPEKDLLEMLAALQPGASIRVEGA